MEFRLSRGNAKINYVRIHKLVSHPPDLLSVNICTALAFNVIFKKKCETCSRSAVSNGLRCQFHIFTNCCIACSCLCKMHSLLSKKTARRFLPAVVCRCYCGVHHSAMTFVSRLSMLIRVLLHSAGCSFRVRNVNFKSCVVPKGSTPSSMDWGNTK